MLPEIHIPGYQYCGPFTQDKTTPPINALDAACQDHDKSYKSRLDYVSYTNSDQQLLNTAKKQKGWAAKLVQIAFQAKKALAPKGTSFDPDYTLPQTQTGKRKNNEVQLQRSKRSRANPESDRFIRYYKRSQPYSNTSDRYLLSKRKKRRNKFKTYRRKW